MFKQGVYEHTYPFCWRCDTPLLYYARTTWYIKTTAFKDRLVANNEQINWVPEHIRDGRFGEWLENNIDWGLARERYWGTPLPFWVCDNPKCDHQECVGSVAELSQKTGRKFMNPRYLAQQTGPLARSGPARDGAARPAPARSGRADLAVRASAAQGTMRRVREVADAWFDSGSMPVAQWHYPFENREVFAEQFPADYICEAIDQTRGWFYTLHAVSTLLFDSVSFKNVICLGHIVAEDGSKMSKSRGNVVNPWTVLDLHGADATRWYMYTASPPGNTRRFSANLVKEVVGRFLLTLWNSYSFFVTYANLNDFDPAAAPVPLAERSVLDRWVLARLHDLVTDVSPALETYDVTGATRPIQRLRRRAEQLVRAPEPPRFWNVGGTGERAENAQLEPGRTPDHVRGAGHARAPARAVHAVHGRRDVLQPGGGRSTVKHPERIVLDKHPERSERHAVGSAVEGGLTRRQRASEPLARAEPALRRPAVAGRHGAGPEGRGPGRAARESASLKLRQPLAEALVGVPSKSEADADPAPGRRGGEGGAERQGAAPGGCRQRPGRRADPPAAEAAWARSTAAGSRPSRPRCRRSIRWPWPMRSRPAGRST